MDTPMVKILSDAAQAESLRQELIQAGVPAGAIAVEVQGDEAGAMKGNFVNGDFEPGRGAGSYEESFRNVLHGGVSILTVSVSEEALCRLTREIFARRPTAPGVAAIQ